MIKRLEKWWLGGSPVEVTKEKKQTVELSTFPYKSLSLGTLNRTLAHGTRWHKIYIPSKLGGYLKIAISRGRGCLYYNDYQTRMKDESGKIYERFRGAREYKIPSKEKIVFYLNMPVRLDIAPRL